MLINGREKVGIGFKKSNDFKNLKNPKAFTDYSQRIHNVWKSKTRVTSSFPRVVSSNLQVTSSNPRIKSSNP